MDRIIKKTQALVVGAGPEAIAAAVSAKQAGVEVAILDAETVQGAPEGITTVDAVVLDKIILYPEGRVAGVMGHQTDDGMKVIVNTDAVLLTPDAAKVYEALCVQFGAVVTNGSIQVKADGLMVNAEGKNIGGMFVINEASGKAGGEYAAWVDQNIYARFREHPMVNEAPKIEGEYYLTIMGMPGVPKHHILIENRDGILSGTHETENDLQPMQDLHMEDGYLCWNLWAGTTSSELFTYHVKPYGQMFLGGTWRIDMDNAHRTPVMMESAHPHNPFGPPKD